MLFVNFPVGLIVWIVYAIVYQQIENYVIQPQIQRRAVAVEPLVILVAVLFGSTLFGVPGRAAGDPDGRVAADRVSASSATTGAS